MSIRSWRLVRRLSVAIALTIVGCSEAPTVSSSSDTEETQEEIQVVTTFLPITQFTQAVAGDRAQVMQLMPANVGPHDFQAKPGDVQAISAADVVVENGLELERFLEDLIDSSGNTDLTVIDSSEGIETLAFEGHSEDEHSDEEHSEDEHSDEEHSEDKHSDEEHSEDEHSDEEHDHSDEEHSEEEHDHSDEEEDHSEEEHSEEGHSAHQHGDLDPHIWLDPKRAILQVENIRDGLIAADPEGEAEYTANATDYIEKLTALDEEITAQLSPYAGQTFISFHDFAAYFAQSYGLEVAFLVDVPEANPSPDDVRKVIDTVQAEDVKALLTESATDTTSFSTLAKDLNVDVGVFNPIATGADASADPDYYLTMMRQNVENLEAALSAL